MLNPKQLVAGALGFEHTLDPSHHPASSWGPLGLETCPTPAAAPAGVSQAFVRGSDWRWGPSHLMLTSSHWESSVTAVTSWDSLKEPQETTAALMPPQDVI